MDNKDMARKVKDLLDKGLLDFDEANNQLIYGYTELAEENIREAEYILPVIFNDLISPNKLPKGVTCEELPGIIEVNKKDET